MCRLLLILLVSVFLSGVVGCQSTPGLSEFSWFQQDQRASFAEPEVRIDRIRMVADKSTGEDTPEQQELVRDLIEPLASENDPMIRQARIEAVAAFNTPLSPKALEAALGDSDPHVRRTACRLLGEKRDPAAAGALAKVAHGDANFDVRIAAAKALGEVGADKKMLLAVLEDPNPAMQLVGVESMRRITGQDLGRDVAAYVALARGEGPAPQATEAVANKKSGWRRFF